MKKYEEYREFTKFITKAIQDLEDEKSKREASDFFLSILTYKRDVKQIIIELDIEKTKLEFYQKWGKYLPEYVKEERDRKIKSLGI